MKKIKFHRAAGLLLHITSLPSKYGIGDMGSDAYKFIDLLSEYGYKFWQVLPLGPTGYGDSPYQTLSAFAGNTLLISPEKLINNNFILESEIPQINSTDPHKVDYGEVIQAKTQILAAAFEKFKSSHNNHAEVFEIFCNENNYWLNDYALYSALKEFYKGAHWINWPKEIALRDTESLNYWRDKLADKILYYKFTQYLFDKQWKELKDYAVSKGIYFIGDIPIYVAYDCADVWCNKELYRLNEDGLLQSAAGVPPDYFSATGQLWGNPLYNWEAMEHTGYKWWIKRLRKTYEFTDIIRIDHFRGFEGYYSIPGYAQTAEYGEWIKGPGENFFDKIFSEMGDVDIIAEDLGMITDEVEKLRDKYNLPGMKVMQFGLGEHGAKNFLPYNYEYNYIAYTGTHDNDTTRGFLESEKEKNSGIYEWTKKFLGPNEKNLVHGLIRSLFASAAKTVIIPMQDVLNLGTEARMNYPGKPEGNWRWRFSWNQIEKKVFNYFKECLIVYERHKSDN